MGPVNSVAITPDGKYFVSGGADKTVKLWEIDSGREIRTFSGHSQSIISVSLSGNGKYVLSASDLDKVMKLWEIDTGKEVRTFNESSHIYAAALSPDGQYALSACDDKTLNLWSIRTGRVVRTFKGHLSGVRSVVITPDGKYALSASFDNTLKLWDIASGNELRTFTGHSKEVRSVAITPDGKYALSASGDATLKMWEIDSGREIKTFKGAFPPVVISSDGKYALSGGDKKHLRLWNIATGRDVGTFIEPSNPVSALALSPNGKHVLSESYGTPLRLWDIATGKDIRTFNGYSGQAGMSAHGDEGYSEQVGSAAISADGRYVVSGGWDKTLKLWDISHGMEMKAFKGHTSAVTSVAISPDGKYALSGSWDNTLGLWDITTATKTATFKGHNSHVSSVTIFPNGKYALSGSWDKTLRLWDISTGKELRLFTGHSEPVTSLSISHDNKYALSGSWDKTLKLWNTTSGKMLRTFSDHSAAVTSVALSSDGRYALSGSWDKTLKLWDTDSGKVLRTFSGHSAPVTSVALSSDNKYVLSAGSDKTLKLWDINTGKELRTFTGHGSGPISVSLSPNGRYVLSAGTAVNTSETSSEYGDKTLRLWDITTGKELVQFASFADGQWVAFTPEGYYNASPNGDKHINVHTGNTVYDISRYRATFYNPQVVKAALTLCNTQQAIAQVLGIDQKNSAVIRIHDIPPPVVVIKSPDNDTEVYSQTQDISINIEDGNNDIKQVSILLNGREVTANAPSRTINIPKGQKTIDLKVPVKLDNGENLIEVFAFNGYSEGRKRLRLTFTPTTLPTLWILSVGVNRYDNKQIPPISYAANDAEAIVAAFEKQRNKLFREVNSLIISDHSDIKPTYDNIVKNLGYFAKAAADDVIILFMSGQGINDNRGGYYFLPSDAAFNNDGSVDPSRAISGRRLKAALDIPVKKLVFADTCRSNQIGGKKNRAVDNDAFVRGLKDVNAVIFTSGRARELSQQSDKWQNGVFTYVISEGISNGGIQIYNSAITIKDLETYMHREVQQLTGGAQHPITYIPEGYVNFPVAMILQQ
ncbi:MAG: hypothetical protein HQL05_13085 [Nitrospirae bacterium]|nr:caspase family protein [Candidatus Magnetobacterium casensis]MBF0338749.1 hypothetical protein [Nitrospirota bacterium]